MAILPLPGTLGSVTTLLMLESEWMNYDLMKWHLPADSYFDMEWITALLKDDRVGSYSDYMVRNTFNAVYVVYAP